MKNVFRYLVLSLVGFLLATATHAATITVTSNADSGAGSLRQALADANNGDTINFNFASVTTITLNSHLSINKSLTIVGPGASLLALNGNNAHRVLYVSGGSNTISGLTVMNGYVDGDKGAGIYVTGATLTLDQCVIRNNSLTDNTNNLSASGGGISTSGTSTLILKRCVVQNNSIPVPTSTTQIYQGGGIYAGGNLFLYDCVFTGNQGRYGSAIYSFNHTLTMENVTLFNNTSTYHGAIYVYYGNASFTNCTISGNAATVMYAGGVSVATASLALRNTVIAGNTSTDSQGNTDLYLASSTLTSLGYNLIGSLGTVTYTPAVGDVTGTEVSPAPTDLLPLGDHGGYVQVCMPLYTSTVIDPASGNGAPFVDARGYLRVNTADKGAAEYNGTLPVATSATNVGTTGFTANWNPVSGAQGYALDVATNSSFASMVSGWGNSLVGNATVLNVSGLSFGTQYYYRIRALAGEHQTYHSNIISGTTLIPTPTPSMTSTSTLTSTYTSSPTQTPTATITPTLTASATSTHSPTHTPTATVTPTLTVSATVTSTSTATPTSTESPTLTVTPERANPDLQGKKLLAYPNPGKGKMTLAFQPSSEGEAKILIYNMSGERVACLNAQVSGDVIARVTWDCSTVAPGLYVVRVLQDGKEIGKSKVAVIK